MADAAEAAVDGTVPDLVVVDFERPGALDAARQLPLDRVIGFARHTSEELIGDARDLGIDLEIRSRFFADLAPRLEAAVLKRSGS